MRYIAWTRQTSKGALKVFGNQKMITYFLYIKLDNLIMWFYFLVFMFDPNLIA